MKQSESENQIKLQETYHGGDGFSNYIPEDQVQLSAEGMSNADDKTKKPADGDKDKKDKTPPKKDDKTPATTTDGEHKILGFIPEEHKWIYFGGIAVVLGVGGWFAWKHFHKAK